MEVKVLLLKQKIFYIDIDIQVLLFGCSLDIENYCGSKSVMCDAI